MKLCKHLSKGIFAKVALLMGLTAASTASAITFSQSASGVIDFNPASASGDSNPGTSGPLLISFNFGGYLGSPGDLAGETLVRVDLSWESEFLDSLAQVTNNNPATASIGIVEQVSQSISAPNINQNLTVSADNNPGDDVGSNSSLVIPLSGSGSTSDLTLSVSPYLTPLADNDILVTITANFNDILFSNQPINNVLFDFFLRQQQNVSLTFVSEAPIPAPAALMLMITGLGGLVLRHKSSDT